MMERERNGCVLGRMEKRGNGVIKLTDGNVAYGFMSRLEGEE